MCILWCRDRHRQRIQQIATELAILKTDEIITFEEETSTGSSVLISSSKYAQPVHADHIADTGLVSLLYLNDVQECTKFLSDQKGGTTCTSRGVSRDVLDKICTAFPLTDDRTLNFNIINDVHEGVYSDIKDAVTKAFPDMATEEVKHSSVCVSVTDFVFKSLFFCLFCFSG